MALISCPECQRDVSTNAAACPHCGNPVPRGAAESYTSRTPNEVKRPRPRVPEEGAGPVDISLPPGPKCYACSAPATTRCQSCGALSCAVHLQSIFVSHGKGGAYELRCQSCYASAQTGQIFGWIVFVIGLIIAAIFFFGFWLPGWNEMGQKHKEMEQRHKEFDKGWEKAQQEQEEFRKKHFPEK